MEKKTEPKVRLERQAHRDAIRRLRKAYEGIRKVGTEVEAGKEQESDTNRSGEKR